MEEQARGLGEEWKSKQEVWERNGRASKRFGRAVSYVGELGGNQERLERTLLLPWVFLVKPCFRLVGKLLPNSFLLLVRS
jgi:hypothetical protein